MKESPSTWRKYAGDSGHLKINCHENCNTSTTKSVFHYNCNFAFIHQCSGPIMKFSSPSGFFRCVPREDDNCHKE